MQFILKEEYLLIEDLVNGTHINAYISIIRVQAPEITDTFRGVFQSFFADLKSHIECIQQACISIICFIIYTNIDNLSFLTGAEPLAFPSALLFSSSCVVRCPARLAPGAPCLLQGSNPLMFPLT